ncbi:septum formation initiator [Streptomyces sp. NPDC052052]|uniref:FtsB family cell division protein n=1 Tax=Streptomyces sp. NPDC052052 TaxID=3154756 RepID=UPI00342FD966
MSRPAGQLRGRAERLVRLMPTGPVNAARTPFVLLVVLLLGGGLITLLVLNSALNEGSFRLSELRKRTTELTDEQQALQRDVDSFSEPDALERRARELGMVPGGNPAFLGLDGKVRGVPVEASAQPIPTTRAPKPTPDVSATASPAASASATPSGDAKPGSAVPSGAVVKPGSSATPSGPSTPANQPSTSPGR